MRPQECAFTFLRDDCGLASLSFQQLDHQARKIAGALQETIRPGDRVLLVFPPGLEFIPAFFGCLYAGALAVPATYPKPRRPSPRLRAIAEDCDAHVALTTSQTLATLDLPRVAPELSALRWIATDQLPDESAATWTRPPLKPEALAFLQYTSGSTSEPKGVMVSHRNLLQNLEMIRQGFDIARVCAASESETGVSWLPAYHDMGLIGGILESLYVGGRTILMSPAAFLQRPLRWLKTISDYRAVISGAPNFAYELCVRKIGPEERSQLDLSSWHVAFCGAEPIRAETLAQFAEAFAPCGFRPDAFYPCYGLAEATLLAAGGHGPARPTVLRVERCALAQHRAAKATSSDELQTQELVACGQPLLDQEIVIANPDTCRQAEPGRVGEVWIRGPNVTQGYWNRPKENEQTFNARLADTGEDQYLRTGDLGFLSEDNLYITGRVKDVIIIRGRNHYPQDIERSVEQSHALLPAGAGAAFSVDCGGRERLVVVHEIERQHRHDDLQEVVRNIRRSIAVEHELDLQAVVLIRQANLPRTTSGKVQRNLCREQYQAGRLKAVAQWVRGDDLVPEKTSEHARSGRAEQRANGHTVHRLDGSGHGQGTVATCGALRGQRTEVAGGVRVAQKARAALLEHSHAPERVPSGKSILPELSLPNRVLRPEEVDRLGEQIQTWIMDWLVQRAGVPSAEITPDRPFAEFGLDSLTAVELSQELEDWLSIELNPVIAWNYPTLELLSRYLAEQLGSGSPSESASAGTAEDAPEAALTAPANDFERLLAEIETLSDEEAEAALAPGKGVGNG